MLFIAAMHGSTDARVLEGFLGARTGEGMRRDSRLARVALTRGLFARGDSLFRVFIFASIKRSKISLTKLSLFPKLGETRLS